VLLHVCLLLSFRLPRCWACINASVAAQRFAVSAQGLLVQTCLLWQSACGWQAWLGLPPAAPSVSEKSDVTLMLTKTLSKASRSCAGVGLCRCLCAPLTASDRFSCLAYPARVYVFTCASSQLYASFAKHC
jgi:hypothetical protein